MKSRGYKEYEADIEQSRGYETSIKEELPVEIKDKILKLVNLLASNSISIKLLKRIKRTFSINIKIYSIKNYIFRLAIV